MRSVGVVIGHYDDRVTTELDQDQGSALVRSDAVSVYLDQKVRGFDLRSRVSVAEHANELAEGDALTGSTSQASFKSRTVELSQRAGYPVAVAGAVLTPWLELTHRRDDAEPFTASNPYTADETYSASGASETLAGIGLDLGAAPILLGEHATLRLFGGLSYAQSLQRESFELKIEEAGGHGATQTETVEREIEAIVADASWDVREGAPEEVPGAVLVNVQEPKDVEAFVAALGGQLPPEQATQAAETHKATSGVVVAPGCSSTLAVPASTTPSTGTTSPSTAKTRSPAWTSEMWTSRKLMSKVGSLLSGTRAVVGSGARSLASVRASSCCTSSNHDDISSISSCMPRMRSWAMRSSSVATTTLVSRARMLRSTRWGCHVHPSPASTRSRESSAISRASALLASAASTADHCSGVKRRPLFACWASQF